MGTLDFTPRIPAPLRLVNRVGARLRRLGLGRGDLDPDVLIAAARRRAGLDEFGPDLGWREALAVYTRSLERDADLHFLGRMHLREVLRRALIDRLRLARVRPRLTALTAPPLVVCGLPRSGTTFLHRLLAEASDARALPLWELMEPIAGPGPDRRRAHALRRLRRMRALTPMDMDAIHLIRADLPDECSYLFKSAFRSAMLWQAPAIGWLEWHLAAPMDGAYREWHDWLRLLQVPGRRLVLKDPFHVGSLPALFAAVPEAMVVRTHRDPLETLPSYHKLTLNMHAVLCARLDVPRVVEANTRWQLALTRAAVDPGPGVPPERVIDVDYRRLCSDPVGTVEHVHRRLGLAWDDALAARVAAYARENSQRRHGDNPYAVEDFGQTPIELRRRFAGYRERFGLDGPRV